MIQRTTDPRRNDCRLRPEARRPPFRVTVADFHRVFFDLQRTDPAAKFKFYTHVDRASRQSAIKFRFVDNLCQGSIGPMLQLPAAG